MVPISDIYVRSYVWWYENGRGWQLEGKERPALQRNNCTNKEGTIVIGRNAHHGKKQMSWKERLPVGRNDCHKKGRLPGGRNDSLVSALETPPLLHHNGCHEVCKYEVGEVDIYLSWMILRIQTHSTSVEFASPGRPYRRLQNTDTSSRILFLQTCINKSFWGEE